MFGRNPCKSKGHDWQSYGWSVMGFGAYRYHLICTRCNTVIDAPVEEDEEEDDRPRDD